MAQKKETPTQYTILLSGEDRLYLKQNKSTYYKDKKITTLPLSEQHFIQTMKHNQERVERSPTTKTWTNAKDKTIDKRVWKTINKLTGIDMLEYINEKRTNEATLDFNS